MEELENNTIFASTLFLPNSYETLWSSNAMINPAITGLFNGGVLRAMWDSGIRYAVGDNSIPSESPAFIYHGWYSSSEVNGFDGIFFIPRCPTDIYYYCNTVANEIQMFNAMYNRTWGIEMILQLEGNVTVGNLLTFRHDPYMFHQNNIKSFVYESKNTSLLELWLQTVSAQLVQFTNLPIVSKRVGDLGLLYQQRMQRDACGLTGSLTFSNGKISALTVEGTTNCTAVITGLPAASCISPQCTYETYGPDITAYVPLHPNTPISFSIASKK